MLDLPAANHAVRRFRRLALITAVIGVLCLLWSFWMGVHFNRGPSSLKLGAQSLRVLLTLLLPGPLLLLLLAGLAGAKFCRAIGWIVMVPALLAALFIAGCAGLALRPLFAPAAYDAACLESQLQTAAFIARDTAVITDFRAVRDALDQQPATRQELESLRQRLVPILARFRALPDTDEAVQFALAEPFRRRSLGFLRWDFFTDRLAHSRLPGLGAEHQWYCRVAETLDRRLALLLDHFGAWTWIDDGVPDFDDPALTTAYQALTPPLKP